MVDVVSVIILVVFAGLGGIAGYLGRIAQKVEERRDEIYLENLPGIYSNLVALKESLQLYSKGGAIGNLTQSLGVASKSLRETIFSSNILVFKEELHDTLYKYFQEIAKLEEVLTSIENSPHRASEEEKFKLKLKQESGDKVYTIGSLTCEPKEILDQTEATSKIIKGKLSRYRSISLWLIFVVFVLGALVSIIEIVKEIFAL